MENTLVLAAFGAATSLVLLIALLLGRQRGQVETRLGELSPQGDWVRSPDPLGALADSTLPRMARPLLPSNEKNRQRLRSRLIQAGAYKKHALVFFLGIKMILIGLPVLLGLFIASMGMLPTRQAVIYGATAGLVGTLAPSLWLDKKKRQRQINIRRALPDALDVIVVCLEAGLSLSAALARVCKELRTAHPLLSAEMSIVQREIQLGRSTGEALREFGQRFDVEEIRSMASVISQAERFGASLVKALRVHADALRLKRQQRAEESARTAATKMLFPTLLFIFPALFVVILGPAAIQIYEVLLPALEK